MTTKKCDRKRVVVRVRALIAMGADISSPNEAAIALERAGKLIAKYRISTAEIEDKEADFGQNEYSTLSGKNKTWISIVALSVSKINNCIVRIKGGDKRTSKKTFVFKGLNEDTMNSVFMMGYLTSTVGAAYSKDRQHYALMGTEDKNNYLLGFAKGISLRINDILHTNEADADGGRDIVVFSTVKSSEQAAPMIEVGCASYLGEQAAKLAHLGRFINAAAEPMAQIA